VTIAHWDEVEGRRRAKGEMDATWQPLGRTAGTKDVGVNRVRVAPGMLPTPPHEHMAAEEVFFVLSGSGLLWQDGAVHEIRAGDCVVQRARSMPRTFRAGPDGLEYLVYGINLRAELGWLPRSRAVRLGPVWVEGRDDDPWDVEETAEPLEFGEPAPRPANVVNLEDVPEDSEGNETWRSLAEAAGCEQAGLHWSQLAPGKYGPPPHVHSEEEEVFVILEGDGTLELWPTPVMERRGVEREEIPVRPGHVVARPPGTKIAHAFRAGEGGLTMLVYGTRSPNDICYYPRSRKIYWRGVGLIGRVEALDYYDGELGFD
jgi:uncharacterized cupin superfamily protein